MAQIGTLEYKAEVSGVAEARKNVNNYEKAQRDSASTTREAASSVGALVGQFTGLNVATKTASRLFNQFDTQVELLGSSLHFLRGQLANVFGGLPFGEGGGGGGGVIGAVTASAIGSSIAEKLSGLSIGSALGGTGGLALGIVGGLALGITGTELLRRWGVIDAIEEGSRALGGMMPGWLRQGLLNVLMMSPAGGLAIVGNFIVGSLEGGFSEGFARAGRTVDIFLANWGRQWDRASGIVRDAMADVRQWLGSVEDRGIGAARQIGDWFDDRLSGLADRIAELRRRADRLRPSVGLPTGGGGGFFANIPFLQGGGEVLRTGVAVVHRGEQVIPSGDGGGVTIENLTINLTGEFDPTSVDPRTLDALGDRVADSIGRRTGGIAGVR